MSDQPTPARPAESRRDRLLNGALIGLIALSVGVGLLQSFQEKDVSEHAASMLPIGAPAPPITAFRHPDKAMVGPAQLQGQVLVLDFWATWCGPCREEAPIIRKLAREYSGKGVTVLAFDEDEVADPIPTVERFLRQQHLDGYPVYYGSGNLVTGFSVQYFPSIYVIGKDGTVRFRNTGATSERRLRKEIEAALKG